MQRGNHTRSKVLHSHTRQSVKSLDEKLRVSEARVQALEAEVRTLRTQVNTLRRRPVLTDRPPGHLAPVFEAETRQHPSNSTLPTFEFETRQQSQRLSESSTFVFKLESPQNDRPNSNKHDWRSPELRRLLKLAPKTDQDWCQRREDIQLSRPEAVIWTFLEFINYTQSKRHFAPSNVTIQFQPSLGEAVLANYRAFVRNLRQDSIRATQISHFGILLFICLCRVARESGESVDKVDALMNDFLPEKKHTTKPERQSSHLRHLRTAVLWPIRQANLMRTKLKHRADEFFLLYGPSIGTYRALYEAKDSEEFAHVVSLPLPSTKDEVHADVSLSVAFMVKLIVGNTFKLNVICKALKTDLSQEQFDASVWAVWTRLSCISYPPAKRRKILEAEATPDNDSRDAALENVLLQLRSGLHYLGAPSQESVYAQTVQVDGRGHHMHQTHRESSSSVPLENGSKLTPVLPSMNGASKSFSPRVNLPRPEVVDHTSLNGTTTPPTSSHSRFAGYTDGTEGIIRSQAHFHRTPDSAARFESRPQHVLGRVVENPELWVLNGDRDIAGHQVAQTLLQLRCPQALEPVSLVPTELPLGSFSHSRGNSPKPFLSNSGGSGGCMTGSLESPEPCNFDTSGLSPLNMSDIFDYPSD
ncbi:hypothetical protein CT0861_05063 [Colletotrichum tofieldiae]|uniref:Uncharacterized protein n=1 Tax=Colletotrichum tofieldiae TaxID=708197 RepID=A0A166MD58_9PEZI|nr:hypothetical protein CT0861_05063 [Colletotrichum tofieldiae]